MTTTRNTTHYTTGLFINCSCLK